MIHLNCKWFTNNKGQREFLIDYAVDDDFKPIILPNIHPLDVGAVKIDGFWCLLEDTDKLLLEDIDNLIKRNSWKI